MITSSNMIDTEILLKGILLGWFIANFEPLQDLYKKYAKPWVELFSTYVAGSFSCSKCMSFWCTLLYGALLKDGFYFWEAILAAIIAYTFERLLYSLKTYL